MCLSIPGRIESIEDEQALLRSGLVSFGGVQKKINLAYVPEAQPGDYVLVHVGFALSVIDEAEAHKVFAWLEQLQEPVT